MLSGFLFVFVLPLVLFRFQFWFWLQVTNVKFLSFIDVSYLTFFPCACVCSCAFAVCTLLPILTHSSDFGLVYEIVSFVQDILEGMLFSYYDSGKIKSREMIGNKYAILFLSFYI